MIKLAKIKAEYVALFLMSFVNSIQIIFGTSTISQFFYFAFFILFISLLLFKERFDFQNWKWIVFLLIGMIGFATNAFSTLSLFVSMALIMFSTNLSKKKAVISLIAPRIILFFIVISLSLLGVLPNHVIYREASDYLLISYRYSLGFSHPNALFWFIFPAYAGYVYLKDANFKTLELIIHVVFFGTLFYFTDCRTGFYVVLVLIFLIAIKKWFPKKAESILNMKIWRFSYVVSAIVSIIIPVLISRGFNCSLFDELNQITSQRISLSVVAVKTFGLSLFGKGINYGDFLIDNSYIYMAQSFGFIFLVSFLLMTYFLIKKSQNENNYALIIVLLSFALYFLFEKVFVNAMNNFSFIFFSELLSVCHQRQNKPLGRFAL